MSSVVCPFCTIVAQQDSNVREVYRDDDVVAFFPTEPAVLGHTLLIPRFHAADIWSLPEELAARLGRASVKLASAVKHAFAPEGLNVIQSNGAAATQTVTRAGCVSEAFARGAFEVTAAGERDVLGRQEMSARADCWRA